MSAERSVPDGDLLERLSRPAATPSVEDTVDAAELQERLGLQTREFAERLLARFDVDGDGRVPRDELVRRVEALMDGDAASKLAFAFAVHDRDGDGRIDRGELHAMMEISLVENRLAFGPRIVERLTDAVFERADANGDGSIDQGEFRSALEHYPGVLEHMTLGDLRWLGLGALPDIPPPSRVPAWVVRWRALLSDGTWVALIAAYLVANTALFVHAFVAYESSGVLVQVARGCGACLNLHGALILLPMCRRALTWLGRGAIGRVLVDDHVAFHRLVGNVAFYLGVAHTVAHSLNYLSSSATVWSWAGVTGVVLLATHAALFFFSREGIRRTRRFELFHLVHRLYPLWIVFMLVHGPHAWLWMSVPIAVYVVDLFLLRSIRHTHARELTALPAEVTRMSIDRPDGFVAEPGDYAWLCVPEIARSEWHPLTISSPPEQEGTLTMHVRSVGNWTRALSELADDRALDAPPVACLLDGPYGTPSADIFDSRFPVLIAAGIGVTPFASVLGSLVERHRRGTPMRVEKAHFVWICKEQHAFSWFADLLGELERDAPELFDIHIFMDAGRTDIKSTVLRVAMDGLYATTDADLVTGLRARTTLGPPEWDALLARVASLHDPDRVDAFYCGPAGLAPVVKRACFRQGLTFRQEHF